MRLPRAIAAHAALLTEGRVIDVALGRANGQRFFLFVGAGLDARIVAAVEQRRARRSGLGGMAQWWLPALRAFLRHDADLSLALEGRTLSRLTQILITRVRRYAGPLDLGLSIDATDGKLHALAFAARSKLAWIGLGLRAWRGALRAGRDLQHVATLGEVRIAAAAAEPYHVDGTAAGHLPVAIALEPTPARFVVPARGL
jgi:diacylglycerol kinase family enzyme